MSDEPIPPANTGAPPIIPSVAPPPIISPPRKSVVPPWVFALLRTVLVAIIVAAITAGMTILFRKSGWEGLWKVTLIGTCGLFAVMSVLVIVGGALDVRKLFRRLRELEETCDNDTAD